MERLWLQSPLATTRPDQKKLNRADYRAASVTGAASVGDAVYSKPPLAVPPGAAPVTPPGVVPGATIDGEVLDAGSGGYLTIYDQDQHFEGCVYVREDHKIMTPDGSLLPPDKFKVEYGGHEFQMQADGARPTKDAWEAFTQNRCKRFPMAKYKCFTPDRPFGEIRDDAVNTFRAPEWEPTEGDVTPFLTLVEKMLPDPTDRSIFLTWCAAMVQNPGQKFQWALVLQGAEGNGKTFLLRCMAYAVGSHMSHFPNPEDMNEKYNTYLEGNLLIGVEEIQMSGHREQLDRLKKYITNDRVEIRGMRTDKRMGDNLTNWIFCTNHKDAVIKTKDDRRYAIFFTAQQNATDLFRDGMDGRFFADLWDWARDGGFAIVATYLHQMPLDERFNPLGDCTRAPNTTTTHEAIHSSFGPWEQELLEAIDQEFSGFRGGWLNSAKAKELLERQGYRKISQNRLSEAIRNIGFEKCKAYKHGRSPRPVHADKTRPRLFCRPEHNRANYNVDQYVATNEDLPPGTQVT
ncbi:Virulence-associated protein E [Shimia gijangensis]|uniref:Virulence-associated protein E n=2 Tax=Shimia gijangensis TaxID=1470563 RepID=A0A1M6S1P2_9RHOB|nr:primase-helicase family protein [Shimia gijangensis]SHK38640.1 Virulence-associated protein E [Shimia gijangensis]